MWVIDTFPPAPPPKGEGRTAVPVVFTPLPLGEGPGVRANISPTLPHYQISELKNLMHLTASPFSLGNSFIHHLDPRVRLGIASLFALLIAISTQFFTLLAGLSYALFLTWMTRLPFSPLRKRLSTLNLFTLLLFLTLPLTTAGLPWFTLGNLVITQEGCTLATVITLKSNTILLLLTALVSTLEITKLGQTLVGLRLSPKLIHLLLFTIRYVEVIHQEFQRLIQAMKIRGFQLHSNWHTYRSLGYLIGMLIVNSADRADRILAAMKCRGFHGQFPKYPRVSLQPSDILFSTVSISLWLGLFGIDWL